MEEAKRPIILQYGGGDWGPSAKVGGHTTKDYVRASRALKQALVMLFGGKCLRCAWSPSTYAEVQAMDFHHRQPSDKKFGVNATEALRRSWASLLMEAEKCDLLCARCHRVVEAEARIDE